MDSYSAFKSFSFVFKSIPKKLVTPLTIVFATILAPHNTGLFLLRNGTFDSKKMSLLTSSIFVNQYKDMTMQSISFSFFK